MDTHAPTVKRADDREAIMPLIDLCKAGRLFEVQAWIAEGFHVNQPAYPGKGQRRMSPLDYAIDRGFHSLVKVLLEAGAVQEPQGYGSPMYQALSKRRFDIVQLLVDNGFDPREVDMAQVFATWDPQIMMYFIERGADIVTDEPFAEALCSRIRTALTQYKKLRPQHPELQAQADIALRHHCYEGNLKWVSLMLWAGANPLPEQLGMAWDEDETLFALQFAALGYHYDVFDLKPIRAIFTDPAMRDLLPFIVRGKGVDVLKRILEAGLDPNDPDTGGCKAIQSCMESLYSYRSVNYYPWEQRGAKRDGDNHHCRDMIKSIHLLAKHGGRWGPRDKSDITAARRGFLHLMPDYAAEFVWIMAKYKACDPQDLVELLRTPAIRSHTLKHRERMEELIECLRGSS